MTDNDLKLRIDANVNDARSILESARKENLLDSQEIIDWQDELNAISVTYK